MSVLTLIPRRKKPAAPVRPSPQIPRYTPQAVPSSCPVPPLLGNKLMGLGRRLHLVKSGCWIARCWTAAVMLLTLQMFLDWLVNLNVGFRALMLAGDIALFVYFFRQPHSPLFLRRPSLEACALLVEKHWPKLRGRVIATIQFSRPRFTKDSPELMQALQQDTVARMAPLDFREIVPLAPLLRYLLGALTVTVLWIFLLIGLRPGSAALLERVFLFPAKVPRKTEVICLSGNKVIPAGEGVVLEAEARGIVPAHGRITLVDDTGRIQEITLDPERDHPDRFSLKIDSVERSMTYTIRLNDGTSDPYKIRTVPRPQVLSITFEQVYPLYTGLGTLKRAVDNLALLAGSRLHIHAVANGSVVAASLKLIGLNQTRPLAINGPDHTELSGAIDIPATGLTGFSVELTDQAGITSGDETQYRIDLLPDRPPDVRLTSPQGLEELYTINAQAVIAFTASDDYGLAKVFLCYRILQSNDNPDETTAAQPAAVASQKIPMDLGPNHPLNVQGSYTWNLAAIQPPVAEGAVLEYWIEAQDANDVTGPGVTDSEHHTIKIVSEMEKRADVMNRLLDKLTNLQDISNDQTKVNQNLHDVIEGKPAVK